jgi:hypothetical protein
MNRQQSQQNESEVFSRAMDASTWAASGHLPCRPFAIFRKENRRKKYRGALDAGRPVKSPMQPIRRPPTQAGGHVQSNRLELPGAPAPATGRGVAFAYEQDLRVTMSQSRRGRPCQSERASSLRCAPARRPLALAWNQEPRIPN